MKDQPGGDAGGSARDVTRPRLLIATGNRHKAEEIESILRGLIPNLDFDVACASDFPGAAEPEETGATFIENAIIKAHAYSRTTGLLSLADDSGLVIDALDGRPGVLSARYAPTAEERNARVLHEMEGIMPERRTARFVCVVALGDPTGSTICDEGTIEGRIGFAARGGGGFGYDPIFIPLANHAGDPANAAGSTLAEYAGGAKNAVSHRGRALAALAGEIANAIKAGRVVA